jgi:hypothetical protein
MDGGVMCVDCHYTEAHKVAGGGYIIARDDIDYEVTCTNCHEEPVHSEEYAAINDHTGKVACQTCHIPLLARDPNLPTQMVPTTASRSLMRRQVCTVRKLVRKVTLSPSIIGGTVG